MLAYLVIASTICLPEVEALKLTYSKYRDRVEIVMVDDIINGDFIDALHGTSALIHVRSPLPGCDGTEALTNVSTLSLFFCTYNGIHLNTLVEHRQWSSQYYLSSH